MDNLKAVAELFAGRHFDREVIILCVRWYLRFKLSLEMMAERGLSMAHTTIMRWVQGYAASHRAVRELKADGWLLADTKLRSSKYLNNLIEQDHRGVKQRIAVMAGFKEFGNAAITIAGIELLHRIRKGQFRLGRLSVQGQAAPEVWNAVLGA